MTFRGKHMRGRPGRGAGFLLLAVSLLAVAVLVLWAAWQRWQDFNSYHDAVAGNAVAQAGQQVAMFIDERQQLVGLFAELERDALVHLATHPDDYDARRRIEERLVRFFPQAHTFTLTDAEGHPLLDDFDGYMGEACYEDVRRFARQGSVPVRIHPNAFVYHFDIMGAWAGGGRSGELLVSFRADDLARVLAAAQARGHALILMNPAAGNLIEVTARGPRNVEFREDYRMTTAELERVRAGFDVPGTAWRLVDQLEPEFVSAFRRDLLVQAGGLIGVVWLMLLAVSGLMWRNEQRRRTAERVRDEFVSVVSHELRTPLTSIRGSLGLLSAMPEASSTEREELFRIALANTDRLKLLVDDLLDLRTIESGRLELHPETRDLRELAEAAVAEQAGFAGSCNVSLRVEAPEGALPVRVDPQRIGQVIGNLLSNAVKFSPPGGEVRVRLSAVNPGAVRLSVLDSGPGVPPEFEPRLFERFAQADSSDTRGQPGTGLGLAIVRELVEAHGGRVGYERRPEGGSCFWFELPLAH